MALPSKRYMSPKQFAEWQKTPYGRYSTGLKKHPFLLFGLPFMATIFAASIYLTEFTSVRYEQYDEKVTLMSEEEALAVDKGKRKVDMKEEYYVSISLRDRKKRELWSFKIGRANSQYRDYSNLAHKTTGNRCACLVLKVKVKMFGECSKESSIY